MVMQIPNFWQQSRLTWLRRRRHNSLSSIMVNGEVVEGVNPVRQAVFMHFKNHFLSDRVARPSVGNLQFQKLSVMEMGTLTKRFSVDEVKATVWDCDNFKSTGSNGINFGFIKNFWHEMKDGILRFTLEFHRNGKLSKGINSKFIALIPKVESPQSLNDF